jgi:hypothetical protein
MKNKKGGWIFGDPPPPPLLYRHLPGKLTEVALPTQHVISAQLGEKPTAGNGPASPCESAVEERVPHHVHRCL